MQVLADKQPLFLVTDPFGGLDPIDYPPLFNDAELRLLNAMVSNPLAFRLVDRNGRPILHQQRGLPVVELRYEQKRKSRNFLYLHYTDRSLDGFLCCAELHCNATPLGKLESKRGGDLIVISGFMELVVPVSTLSVMHERKLNSLNQENIVCLKLFVALVPPFCVLFYREQRLYRKSKQMLTCNNEVIGAASAPVEDWIDCLLL